MTLDPIGTDLKYYSKFKNPELKRAVCVAEEMLIRKDLKYTLSALRKRYEGDARDHEHWDRLTERLPRLYPAGKLPEAPPVHMKEMRDGSVALKFAELEYGQPPSPLRGDEPWTRNDDKHWDIVKKRPIPGEKLGFLDVARKRKRHTSLCSSEDLPCKRSRFHQDAYDSKCYDGEQPLQRPFDDFNNQAASISTRKTTKGKKAAGLGVKVSLAPSTVEKRTAYNDNVSDVDDVAADGDLDTPIASTKSNLKRTASAATKPIKSVLCRPIVGVIAPLAMKAKKISSSKVHRLSPTTTTVRLTTTRTSHRKTQHVDPTYEDSPSSSPTTP